jgi:outer membrane protein
LRRSKRHGLPTFENQKSNPTQEGLAMKKAVAAALFAFVLVSAPIRAQVGDPWMVRVRLVDLKMDNSSDAGSGALSGLPSNAIDVNSKWIPEIDISYFFTNALSLELVLTVPQSQTVTVAGTDVGSFRHLPPSLLGQYHFTGFFDHFTPYVGVGINYTRIMNQNFIVPGLALENHSFGPAIQVGVDVPVQKSWSVNLDVKKVWISSDVTLNGQKVSNVSLDPWLLGIGIGYRF